MSDESEANWKPETLAVHGGEPRPHHDGSVVQPIFQSATWINEADEPEPRYLRLSNSPNQRATASKIAALEGVEAGPCEADVEYGVELVGARPVQVGVFFREYVQLDRAGRRVDLL